jgi:cation diffusion facilitator family transporter
MRARTGEKPVAVYGALAANVGIAGMKFFVAALSGSSAMLSEAIHSSVDTVNELLLLLGVHLGRRRATPSHPYGHGKELYFWGFVVAIVVFAGGGSMALYDGVAQLRHPSPAHALEWKIGVLLGAFVFESVSLAIGLRSLDRRPAESFWSAMRRSKDPAVYTVVIEDLAALGGLVAALVGIVLAHAFHAPRIDGAASIAIGAILCAAAVVLGAESRDLLVGEGASARLVASVRRIAESDPAVRRVGDPLTMRLGPDDVLVNLTIELDPLLPGRDVALTIDRIEVAVRKEHPNVGRIFLEPRLYVESMDAGVPNSRG